MAKIATCPTCAKQLGLPDSISVTDRVECPECHTAFSLSETVQISLPVAQVLAPSTAEPEVASPLLANLTAPSEAKTEVPTSAPPLQQSWEERLRKVLAKGDPSDELGFEQESQAPAKATDFSKIPELLNEKPVAETKKQPVPSPLPELNLNLDFDSPAMAKTVTPEVAKKTTAKPAEKPIAKPIAEAVKSPAKPESKSELLDRTLQAAMPQMAMVAPTSKPKPPTQKKPASATKSKIAPGKTLAELSTSSASASLELGNTVAQTTKAAMTVTKKAAAKPAAVAKVTTKKTISSATKTLAEVAPKIDPRRRLARRGFPKVAAFAVGPIAGCLLGLYGLLWLQGERADHISLGKILPAAMLPASVNEAYCTESLLVEAEETASELETVGDDEALAAFQHDAAVETASAELPVKQISPLVQLRMDEFAVRVEAASLALPNLVTGDFSTREYIRTKGQAYMTLCQLAEHFDDAQQPGVRMQARRAKEVFRQAVEQASNREELAHIAGEWWLHSDRTSRGIFLAGQIQRTEPIADGTICWVKLSEQSNALTIPVWFQQGNSQQPQTGDTLGIVGHITDNLAAFPAGFTGSQVVVTSYNFSLAPAP